MVSAARLAIAAALLAAPLLAAAPAAADTTPPDVTVTVRGTQGDGVWFRGPVRVNWTVSDADSATGFVVEEGCEPSLQITQDTTGAVRVCRVTSEGGTTAKSVTVRVDQTAPVVATPAPARGPDAGGWYNRAVDIAWSAADATSGVASCDASRYAGPDTAGGAVSGSCRDAAGNVGAPQPFALRFDATPPSVAGALADRPARPTGWYTAPVDLVWAGSDVLSGVASCSALRYAGTPAVPSGTCLDRAGNTSAPTPALVRYDAAAPGLERVRVARAATTARLAWRASGADRFRVIRRPGRAGAEVSTVHTGREARYVDRGLRKGRSYRYVVEATDEAGNATRVRARPGAVAPRGWLVAPVADARLAAPPVLSWRAVGGAAFYNVQLLRGTRKIRSAWPSAPRLQLTARWRWGGREQRLVPGRYRWYVWAAHGRRSAPRFGRLLGSRSFTVTAGAR